MKKKALALLLAMAMTATMAGCGLAATTAPDNSSNNDSTNDSTKSDNTEVGTYGSSAETQGKTNPIVVKVSNGAGETSPGVKAQLSVFAPMVENNSKGNIGVEVYSGAQLGDDTTATEMVVAGQLEINNTSTAPLVGYVPELGIFDIPFLFADEAEADKVLASEVGDYLNAKLADKGIINLAWNENGFRELTNSKHEVKTLDDMKNLKIRVAGSNLLMECYKRWGADATNMNWSETYTALQQNTVEGQENPLPAIDAASVQEVQPYCSMWDAIYDCLFFCINQDIYDGLTPEQQAVVDKAGRMAVEYERYINRSGANEIMNRWEEKNGVTFTAKEDMDIDSFKEAVEGVDQWFVEELKNQGYDDGQELVDAFK